VDDDKFADISELVTESGSRQIVVAQQAGDVECR